MSVIPAQSTELAPPNEMGSVIVVRRNDDRVRAGQGMFGGMRRVATHFAQSFIKKQDSKADVLGSFTVEYPEERLLLPEASRQLPILLYDDVSGHELCTSCFQCERVCPPQVIHITQAKDPATGKAVPAAEEFIIEYDTCMSCGYCAEVCPFDAIKMDHNYELSTPDHISMDVHKRELDRPVSYYANHIAPKMWAEVRDQALKKLQNNIKRRPGLIGVAPQMQGKVGKTTAAAAGPKAAAGASSAPKMPVAAIGKNMSPDKIARLQAIRAAKASGAPAEDVAVATVDPSAEMSATTSGTTAAPAAATGPVAAVGKTMSPEKLARLEAIRAAKRAQEG